MRRAIHPPAVTRLRTTLRRLALPGRPVALALGVFLGTGCVDAAPALFDLPKRAHEFDRSERYMVAMRDGVHLRTDVYFPEGEGPWPVILLRNPYNMANNFAFLGKLLSGYGYAVVHQDVRGRFDSEGEWLPLLNERRDGRDTLAWLGEQPWQDGNWALLGASYLSAVQWAVADVLPPEVKTLVPMIISTDLRDVVYEDGMFRHEVFSFWAAMMHDETMDLLNAVNYQQAIRHWPPIEVDERFYGDRLPWYREWMQSVSGTSRLWQRDDAKLLETAPEQVDVPVLMLSGWYDIFNRGQLEDFRRLGSRERSRIIVGPWTHLLGIIGDGDKPFPDAGSVAGQMDRIVNWLDHHLRGEELDNWGPVATYAIGEGRWYERPAWPPAVDQHRLFLRFADNAKGCGGGGLVTAPGRMAESVAYTYNPRNPVPSRGGSGLLSFVMPGWGGTPPSNRDQAGLCQRHDVFTFVSRTLAKPMHIAGPMRVRLTVASDAEDTAFTAKLIEVNARGRALNIRDGITSLAYRNGATVPVAYEPGTPVTVTIDLAPIEWELQPGHRLRLDVSSSNFPAFHAHPNRRGPWALIGQPVKARQTVYFGEDRPSFVDLPLRSRGAAVAAVHPPAGAGAALAQAVGAGPMRSSTK